MQPKAPPRGDLTPSEVAFLRNALTGGSLVYRAFDDRVVSKLQGLGLVQIARTSDPTFQIVSLTAHGKEMLLQLGTGNR